MNHKLKYYRVLTHSQLGKTYSCTPCLFIAFSLIFLLPHDYTINNLDVGITRDIKNFRMKALLSQKARWGLMVLSTKWSKICVLCFTWPCQGLTEDPRAIQARLCAGIASARMMSWNNASCPHPWGADAVHLTQGWDSWAKGDNRILIMESLVEGTCTN